MERGATNKKGIRLRKASEKRESNAFGANGERSDEEKGDLTEASE
jgi:hypothetical protein